MRKAVAIGAGVALSILTWAQALGFSAYFVLFDVGSSEITPAGPAVLNDVVAEVQRGGVRHIWLTGHSDRSGSRSVNLALSLRRAEAVRDALIAGGVAPRLLSLIGRGESRTRSSSAT